MYKDKIDRDINDAWYFFIDIVGASNPSLSIACQLEKIKKLKDSQCDHEIMGRTLAVARVGERKGKCVYELRSFVL